MDTNKKNKRDKGGVQPRSVNTMGMSLLTCFMIIWAACCMCLLMQSLLRSAHSSMPREIEEARNVNDLVGARASATVYASKSFHSDNIASPASAGNTTSNNPFLPALSDIVPVDTCLIRQDEKYTVTSAQRLLDYKEARQKSNTFSLPDFIRSAILFGFILICFGTCLYCLRDNFFERSSRISLCMLFIFLHMVMLLLVQHAFQNYVYGGSFHLQVLLPVALFPSLGAYLLGMRFGICITMLLAIMTPTFIGGECQHMMFLHTIITSFSGIALFHKVSNRKGFLLGGLSLVGIILLLSLFFLWQTPNNGVWQQWSDFFHTVFSQDKQTQWPHFWLALLSMALLNGFGIAIALFFLPAVCERFFDVITPIALHELSSMDHPLLNRLNDEAKGTYNHSIQVAQLAYDAAQAIGANKILAKVCGMFHDIGKLRNPEYFVENLHGDQPNPHAELTPVKSCAKIRDHVTYGGDLARKYALQRPIVEAIVCHHGTDTISYFYHKACEEAKAKGEPEPNKEDFSYAGPLPRRKEAVIVEIADICEAASRAELSKKDHIDRTEVREFVEKLIVNKMKNHQFDNADITFGELHAVGDAIADSLCQLFHGRPSYNNSQSQADAPHPLAAEKGSLTSLDLTADIPHDAPVNASKPEESQPQPETPAPETPSPDEL